jgi:hypothetical protein
MAPRQGSAVDGEHTGLLGRRQVVDGEAQFHQCRGDDRHAATRVEDSDTRCRLRGR